MFKLAKEQGLPYSLVFCFKWTALSIQTQGIPFGRRGKNLENCYIFLLWAAQFRFCKDADVCSKPQRQLRARPALPQGPSAIGSVSLQDTRSCRLLALASDLCCCLAPIGAGRSWARSPALKNFIWIPEAGRSHSAMLRGRILSQK